jgi:hypothetical protein
MAAASTLPPIDESRRNVSQATSATGWSGPVLELRELGGERLWPVALRLVD